MVPLLARHTGPYDGSFVFGFSICQIDSGREWRRAEILPGSLDFVLHVMDCWTLDYSDNIIRSSSTTPKSHQAHIRGSENALACDYEI